jgi:hypothetical protein
VRLFETEFSVPGPNSKDFVIVVAKTISLKPKNTTNVNINNVDVLFIVFISLRFLFG